MSAHAAGRITIGGFPGWEHGVAAVSALDVVVRAQILALLAELAGRLGLACLFVSHDLNVVRSIANRVYVMRRGRIVEEGVTESLFASPRHEYTAGLIAATPQLQGGRVA